MAQFQEAYSIVLKHEGGYLNDPADHGGETYKGIARAFYPGWLGWSLVDLAKYKYGGTLPTNYKISSAMLDQYVQTHYFEMWQRYRLDEINSQQVANIFFDFIVLASRAVALMQQTLNGLGFTVAVDNVIGTQTINAINQANANQLHDAYKDGRLAYHKTRVNDGLVDAKFLPGWISRTQLFSNTTTGKTALVVSVALAVVIMYLKFNNNSKNQITNEND